MNTFDYRDILNRELKGRQAINSRYSLRAFAKDLEISPSRLSEILSRKGHLSKLRSIEVVKKLKLSNEESQLFIDLVELYQTPKNKEKVLERISQKEQLMANLERDQESILSNWYILPIISVMELSSYDGTLEFISNKLGLKIDRINEIVSLLLSLDYVEKSKDVFHFKGERFSSSQDIPSQVIKQYHRNSIKKASEALEEVEVLKRDFSSITLKVDPTKMPKAKVLIQKFRKEMSDLVENTKSESIYQLNIQLFPIEKRVSNEDKL